MNNEWDVHFIFQYPIPSKFYIDLSTFENPF